MSRLLQPAPLSLILALALPFFLFAVVGERHYERELQTKVEKRFRETCAHSWTDCKRLLEQSTDNCFHYAAVSGRRSTIGVDSRRFVRCVEMGFDAWLADHRAHPTTRAADMQ